MAYHFVSRGICRLNDIASNTAEVKNRSLVDARSMINCILQKEAELGQKHQANALRCKESVTDAAIQSFNLPSANRCVEEDIRENLDFDAIQTNHYWQVLLIKERSLIQKE